jgi:hypothetical protein
MELILVHSSLRSKGPKLFLLVCCPWISSMYPAHMTVGNFGIGYTMRFPRCRYIYWDKASRDHPTGDDTQDRDMWNCVRLPLHNPTCANPM